MLVMSCVAGSSESPTNWYTLFIYVLQGDIYVPHSVDKKTRETNAWLMPEHHSATKTVPQECYSWERFVVRRTGILIWISIHLSFPCILHSDIRTSRRSWTWMFPSRMRSFSLWHRFVWHFLLIRRVNSEFQWTEFSWLWIEYRWPSILMWTSYNCIFTPYRWTSWVRSTSR